MESGGPSARPEERSQPPPRPSQVDRTAYVGPLGRWIAGWPVRGRDPGAAPTTQLHGSPVSGLSIKGPSGRSTGQLAAARRALDSASWMA